MTDRDATSRWFRSGKLELTILGESTRKAISEANAWLVEASADPEPEAAGRPSTG